MKTTSLITICLAMTLATTVFALTTEREITMAYVREHPNEFSVKVVKGKDGLIEFTITHNVATPMYHVAHLAVYHRGKLITTSDTPLFGKKNDNKFHFSIAVGNIAESKFDLSDSAVGYSPNGDAAPVPGTIENRFRLLDFVPKEMLKLSPNK